MGKVLKENWFKLLIVIILLMVGLAAIYCFVIIIPRQQQQASSAANNLALQSQCANAADKFYTNNGDYKSVAGVNTSYQDHFNSQLNKCFILISAYMPSDDSLSIDLYDALGGQHYASYYGHQDCSLGYLVITNQAMNKCQFDAGNIWANGDDTSSSTYHVGSNGTGDASMLPQFMAHIQPFMSN